MKSHVKKWAVHQIPGLMFKFLLIPGLAFVIGMMPVTVSAVTFTVNSTDDTSDADWKDDLCDDGAGACTLRAAVEQSEATVAADVIEIPQNLGPIDLLVTGQAGRLTIQKELTIRGLGNNRKKIQGGLNFNSELIYVGATTVILENLELTAKGGGGSGGAIVSFYADLTLKNCYVHGNNAEAAVKVIVQELASNKLSLEDSIVSGNDQAGVLFIIYAGGTGSPRLKILRSTLSQNNGTGLITRKSGEPWAAIQLEVTDSTIAGNGYGGLVLDAAFSTISGSLIENNATTDIRGGGGIWTGNYTWVLYSTVRGNSAVRPAGGGGGGGIRAESRIAIFGSTIANNDADVGGGLDLRGVNPPTPSQVVNSTVSGNRAKVNGGGLFSQTDVDIQCSTIALNQADSDENDAGDGGGIFASADEVRLHSSILGGNWSRTTGPFSILVAPDCTQTGTGSFTSGGYNMISSKRDCTITLLGTDVQGVGEQHGLQPLKDNGGPTWTHALATPTLALDKGDPQGCTWNSDQDEQTPEVAVIGDQRRYTRPADGGTGMLPDMGAFELNGIFPDGIFVDGFEGPP